MFRPVRSLGLLFLTLLAGLGPAAAQTSVPIKGVLELFTSQGCSSCPPADKLLWEFSDRSDLLVMSVHVDVWDYLGWKDTLSTPEGSKRQRFYAVARGDKRIYTPQMIVNGVTHAVGSDKTAIEAALNDTKATPYMLSVPVSVKRNGDNLTITLPETKAYPGKSDVWIFGISPVAQVRIERGENSGNSVQYRNSVRHLAKIGEWTADHATFTVSKADWPQDVRKAVVLVQASNGQGKPGVVLGATMVKIVD